MTTLPPTMGPSPTLPVIVASIADPSSLSDAPPLSPPPSLPRPDSNRSKSVAEVEGNNLYVLAIRKSFAPLRSVQEQRSFFELRLGSL